MPVLGRARKPVGPHQRSGPLLATNRQSVTAPSAPMTARYEKDETAALAGWTETTLTAQAGLPCRGVHIDVNDVSRRVRVRNRGEVTLLEAVSFTVAAGELVAIVGPSGAGKTTLLEAIAGIAPATSGSVRFDGIDVHANLRKFRSVLGYVPQDDIIHADLPLRHMLRYAARLRLPSSTTADRGRRRRP